MDLRWRGLRLVLALAAAAITPALGQPASESLPDFSGVWLHTLPGFEPLPSGPTALINRSRRANGTGDILRLTGDYTNPILKSEAAALGKKHAELGLNWISHSEPRNPSWAGGGTFLFTKCPTELGSQPDKNTIPF